MGDFFARGVRKADVEDAFAVAGGHRDSVVDGFEDIGFYEVSLAEDLYARTIAIEDVPVLDELCELDFCHFHQSVHLVLGSFEVLDAEGVDGDMGDAGFVAHFQYLQVCQRPLSDLR